MSLNLRKHPLLTFPIELTFKCAMIILATWARHGFAATHNITQQKNSLFMHRPTFIEELYHRNSIQTSQKLFSRQSIEDGSIPVELFKKTFFAPQEIYRIAKEEIEKLTQTNGEISELEQQRIIQNAFKEKGQTMDPQAIEGVALALAPGPASKLMDAFLRLNDFNSYVPNIFLNSIHLIKEDLKKRKIVKLDHIEYQFSKVKIASVEFTHTLRYEITRTPKPFKIQTQEGYPASGHQEELMDCITVAWEIDSQFEDDPQFSQKGVLINSGTFSIEPYTDENGFGDPNRSLILYHIYIKIDPLNFLIDLISDLFKDSEARSIIHSLAAAMQKEVLK